MGTDNQGPEPETDDDDQDRDSLETQRSILRRSLDEIARDVGIAMRAGLNFPLGLTVPCSGASLITMVTPVDPTDDDWAHATKIVCQVVTEILGGVRLRSRPLRCAMANAAMTAAEITPNALAFDTRL